MTAPIGPLSSYARLRRLDGRTKAARFLKQTERALIEHLGGPDQVTAPQRLLIERTAADLLRIEMFDAKIAKGQLTDLDGRVLHALQNAVSRNLRALNLKPIARANAPTLDEIAAEIERQEAAQ